MNASAIARGLLVCALLAANSHADDGHDHGPKAPVETGAVAPRFAAVSEAYELVGVLSGTHLILYLDRASDNAPVKDARLEVELNGTKVEVKPLAEGEYEIVLAGEPKPGTIPILASVVAGKESDLLTGELTVPEHAHAASAATHDWKSYARWVGGALLLVITIALALLRTRRRPSLEREGA